MRHPFIALVLVATSFLLGMYVGRNSVQSCNNLLSVGFRIFDPEGYEVEKFDESNVDYWTTTPK